MTAEIKKLREQVTGLELERDSLKGQRDSALALSKQWEVISGEWQAAATARKSAVDTSVKIDTNQIDMQAKTEAELDRTRVLLDKCRNPGFFGSLFKTDTLVKGGIGFALGRATSKQ